MQILVIDYKKIEFDPNLNCIKGPKDWQWRLFLTLQTLDVLTTAEGLTYDCISN